MEYSSVERSLDEPNTTSSTAFRPPSSCLVDNATSERNARCCRKRTNTTARTSCAYRVATEFPLTICVYVVINFLCMFIYDFSCLNLVSVPSTIHFLDCHLALEFCTAYVGLITFGGICASPGIVFVRYAPYICALQVRYARYTRSPQ